jgi:hypothetical protein
MIQNKKIPTAYEWPALAQGARPLLGSMPYIRRTLLSLQPDPSYVVAALAIASAHVLGRLSSLRMYTPGRLVNDAGACYLIERRTSSRPERQEYYEYIGI